MTEKLRQYKPDDTKARAVIYNNENAQIQKNDLVQPLARRAQTQLKNQLCRKQQPIA